MRSELLPPRHQWLRIAEKGWKDPLDPSFAATLGGRWNPPGSFPTLYLNEDLVTARFNLRLFVSGWPYEPEDLQNAGGPVLVHATLPRAQRVVDGHTPEGLLALGLPVTYPLDRKKRVIPHAVCQPIGKAVFHAKLRGVRARSAAVPEGAGRELAWFPATAASRARMIRVEAFEAWYWK